jgi:hypothetical protein
MSRKCCDDCKWVRNPGRFAECRAPQNLTTDVTSKGTPKRLTYCSTIRADGWIWARLLDLCGHEGRWFVLKGETTDVPRTCGRCGEANPDHLDMDGCRDPNCPEQGQRRVDETLSLSGTIGFSES